MTDDPDLIYEALTEHLKLFSPALPIALPGEKFDPNVEAQDGHYIVVDSFPNGHAFQGLSRGRVPRGLFQVSVVWGAEEGAVAPLRVVRDILAHYAQGTKMRRGAVTVKISGEPRYAAAIGGADKVMIPVIIPWTA